MHIVIKNWQNEENILIEARSLRKVQDLCILNFRFKKELRILRKQSGLFFFLLFTRPILYLSFGWMLCLGFFKFTHTWYLFFLWFASFWVQQRSALYGNFCFFNFCSSCLFDCEFVLHFFTWFLCRLTLFYEFIGQSVCSCPSQFFYIIDTIVFGSQHRCVHALWSHCDFFISVNEIIPANQFFVSFESEIKLILHSFDVNESHCIINQTHFKDFIFFGVSAHTGSSINFQKPSFTVWVKYEIKSIQLKGLWTIGDQFLDSQ